MKYIVFILAIILFANCKNSGEKKEEKKIDLNLEIIDLVKDQIPSSIKIKGELIIAKKWNDLNGENLLVVTYKGPIPETEYEYEFSGDEHYAELFGEQYIKKENGYELLWDIYDFERHCPFDLWIGLLPNSTTITDLNKNGITETSLVYKITCRSDITPSRMKILIHENENKYELRGYMLIPRFSPFDTMNLEKFEINKMNSKELFQGNDSYLNVFGKYENEDDFKDVPKEFLEQGRKLWRKYYTKDEFLQF